MQLVDSYVLLKDGEAWLIGGQITLLPTASTHVVAGSPRDRKLLLSRREQAKLFAETQQNVVGFCPDMGPSISGTLSILLNT